MTAMNTDPTNPATAAETQIGIDQLVSPTGGYTMALAATDPGEVAVLRYRLPPRGYLVRELRGAKMATVAALLDEFAAAFQFPYYFGENKDAFDECMRDLDEFVGAAAGYVVVIRDAERVLSADPDQRPWFYDALRLYARQWADRGQVAFRVVLQGVPAHIRRNVTGAELPTLTLAE